MNLIESNRMKWSKYIEFFFVFFICFQPFLDVLAFLDLPFSELIRVAAMGIGCIYVLLLPKSKMKNFALTYLVVLGVFICSHFVNNFLVKEPFNLGQEVNYIIKTLFVVIMLIIYPLIFQSIIKKDNWQEIIQRNIFISMSIIGIIMLIADLTSTGKRSYGQLVKEGHSGWFFSGNELSAILAMGLSLMILYMIKKNNLKHKILLLPFIIVVAWSSLQIGTKVGLGACVFVLGVAFIGILIAQIIKKGQFINALFIGGLLIATLAYVPISPVWNNMNVMVEDTGEDDLGEFDNGLGEGEDESFPEGNVDENGEPKANHSILQNKWVIKLLSGRANFFENTLTQFENSPNSQKILGMGIGGNYETEEQMKLIEIDYFDWFFGYGILGSIILFSLFIFYGFFIIKGIVDRLKLKNVNISYLLVFVSVGLGLGVAFFAGHVLLNPASGIYLAIALAYLYVLSIHPSDKLK
ncbi:O-antigen ligase family protein [Gracilibacillus salinarum]|uniref:O-antigen ligase family protein n=1 Tax=Gracilibacillus salinarum TaxID=2932255 RepID=A0ABY4GRZ4_9BACI|nr:O-antigen ligase family protein [Gracilibacillus salinarum]UOQ87054.1 O-antigen ligase family protein [Gracilibacillus salinarum]